MPGHTFATRKEGVIYGCDRPIMTPHGPFRSIRSASKSYGITVKTMWDKVRRKVSGYYYL